MLTSCLSEHTLYDSGWRVKDANISTLFSIVYLIGLAYPWHTPVLVLLRCKLSQIVVLLSIVFDRILR
jgi:uncharacterized membrane protein YciS (DUF1049 family)